MREEGTGGVGVTLVVARRAKPGCEAALEQWTSDVIVEASRFPGHLGAVVLRPGPGQPDYVLIVRYQTYEDLRRWQDSAKCHELVRRSEVLVSSPARLWTKTGLETWFSLPDHPRAGPPPAWKMALLTWVIITLLSLVMGMTIGPFIARWPMIARTGISAALMVTLMTWVVMPRVTRLFMRWLYEGGMR